MLHCWPSSHSQEDQTLQQQPQSFLEKGLVYYTASRREAKGQRPLLSNRFSIFLLIHAHTYFGLNSIYVRVIKFLRIFEFCNWHAMRGGQMLPESISEEKLEID